MEHRDAITWRQILTGYGLCFGMLLAMLSVLLAPPGPGQQPHGLLVGTGVVLLGLGLRALFRPLGRWLAAHWLRADPQREQRVKTLAVLLLCLSSLGIGWVAALVTWQVHPA